MPLGRHTRDNKAMSEVRLHALPATGEGGIAGRQRPDRMQVIRQDHDCIDRERTLVSHNTDAIREVPMCLAGRGRPIDERDGEE